MIICNGVPKNGTNLLQKTCALIGFKDSAVFLVQHKPNATIKAREITDSGKKKIDWSYANTFSDDYFCHAHIAYPVITDLSNHKVINIWRDPRDAAVSFIRWADRRNKGFKNTKHDLKRLLQFGYGGAPTWAQLYKNYIEWLNDPTCLNLTWNNLQNGVAFDDLQNFLNISFDSDYVLNNLWGNGKVLPTGVAAYKSLSSFSGEVSNFTNYWSDDIDKIWTDLGGYELCYLIKSLE
jgi:hypothetical protein